MIFRGKNVHQRSFNGLALTNDVNVAWNNENAIMQQCNDEIYFKKLILIITPLGGSCYRINSTYFVEIAKNGINGKE